MYLEEADGVPHHLVGFLSPNQSYTVQDFVYNASNIINDIHKTNKIPIIAGGTLYYSESLLFKNFCSESALKLNTKNNNHHRNDGKNKEINKDIEQKLNGIKDEELWNELNKIDPIMANFYHKNNHRRIRRSLEVYYETGKCHSSLIKQYGGKWSDLRYDPLIIWLDADINVIDDRINKRLTTMEDKGIFEELENLYEFFIKEYNYDALADNNGNIKHNNDEKKSNESSTPYISIAHGFGFQAFIPWLKAKYKDKISDKEEIIKIRQECIDKYGLDTRRYARKQKRWLKNRISRLALLLPIYRFDTSDKDKWNDIVLKPAIKIVTSFLDNKVIDEDIIKQLESVNKLGNLKDMERSKEIISLQDWKNFECGQCEKTLHGELEYNEHLKSKKHQKRLRNLKRQQLNNFLRYENYMNVDWHEIHSF